MMILIVLGFIVDIVTINIVGVSYGVGFVMMMLTFIMGIVSHIDKMVR